MRYFRRTENPSFIIGVFLLVALWMFARNYIQDAIGSVIPGANEGVFSCDRLRRSENRAAHQSLLGRAVTGPFILSVEASPYPTNGALVITITITNNSLGAVPMIYNPNQLQIGDAGLSGLGIVFNSNAALSAGVPQGNFIPESDIRVLAPRQSCVHVQQFPITQLPDPSIGSGNASVKAYYRSTSPGAAQSQDALATPIYGDLGLWVGIVESPSVIIPLSAGL